MSRWFDWPQPRPGLIGPLSSQFSSYTYRRTTSGTLRWWSFGLSSTFLSVSDPTIFQRCSLLWRCSWTWLFISKDLSFPRLNWFMLLAYRLPCRILPTLRNISLGFVRPFQGCPTLIIFQAISRLIRSKNVGKFVSSPTDTVTVSFQFIRGI